MAFGLMPQTPIIGISTIITNINKIIVTTTTTTTNNDNTYQRIGANDTPSLEGFGRL